MERIEDTLHMDREPKEPKEGSSHDASQGLYQLLSQISSRLADLEKKFDNAVNAVDGLNTGVLCFI